MIKVSIGIQARSTSNRLPGKVLKKIGSVTVLEMVLDCANNASHYINRGTLKSGVISNVCVLAPVKDPVVDFCRSKHVPVLEGDENNVLSRYKNLMDVHDSDYIVRITSDCPFVPPAYISKAINTAIKNRLDYCSNVDPRFRTAPDGFDVEVISRRAMIWLSETATESQDKEHVTTKIRSTSMPYVFKVGVIIGHIDLSHIKISIDDIDDFNRCVDHLENLNSKINLAREIYGQTSVHRF